ncbi:hypothetical protein ACFQZJ_07460 [Maribacter chungangensis]|uniref:Uncharacterized protein n=1 Tax=Maribacter chungangensis TaxID=1069117 RepID=A0ABW3B2F8_9FLAO
MSAEKRLPAIERAGRIPPPGARGSREGWKAQALVAQHGVRCSKTGCDKNRPALGIEPLSELFFELGTGTGQHTVEYIKRRKQIRRHKTKKSDWRKPDRSVAVAVLKTETA